MARDGAAFVCQSCGAVQSKWAGQCPACQAWNSLVEEVQSRPPGALAPSRRGKAPGINFEGLEMTAASPPRLVTGVEEFDRVCGGGVVPGSAILVAGDPGVGKSTLLLQVVGQAAARGLACAYISGEEAVEQIRARAQRMGLSTAPVKLAAETALREILDALKREPFDLVVVDSVQTLWSDAHEAGPGSVTQVRACAGELVRLAKKRGAAIIMVGHVTKDGQIAGPRVVEHMVDAVLSFEGERGYPFRILRGVKNRFGATDEIGVFEMGDAGLSEVKNPSALFLNDGGERAAGAAVFAGIEGSRPVLVEVQALVAPSSYGTPRRAVVGWDSGRLAMVLAVLEARCGLSFGNKDVYLNVAGGLRISEPAADLAAAAALASSALEEALPQDCVVFGEISLSGDVRPVSRAETRLKEAAKLGFSKALAPAGADGAGIRITAVSRLTDAVRRIGEQDFSMTLFDVICLGVLGLSGLAGFLRGAAREVSAVVAFIVATIIALYALRFTGPLARSAIDPDWLANVAAIIVVFVIAYVAVRLAASALSRSLQNTEGLNVIDRTIGFAFGLVRGLVVLGAFNLAFNIATPPERMPSWIKDAMLYPLTSACADVLRAFAPQGSRVAGEVAPVLERAVRRGEAPGNGATPDERKAMDDLVERSR